MQEDNKIGLAFYSTMDYSQLIEQLGGIIRMKIPTPDGKSLYISIKIANDQEIIEKIKHLEGVSNVYYDTVYVASRY